MGSASDSDFRPPDSTSQDGELPLPDSDGEGGCLSGCCLAQLVEDQRPVLEEADTDQVEDQFSGHNEQDMMNGYEDSHQVSSQFQNYYNYHSIDDEECSNGPYRNDVILNKDEEQLSEKRIQEECLKYEDGSELAPAASRTIADEAEISRTSSEEAVMSRTIADEVEISRTSADEVEMCRTSADEVEMSRTSAEEVEMSKTSANEAEMSRTIAEEAEMSRTTEAEIEDAKENNGEVINQIEAIKIDESVKACDINKSEESD